VYYDGCLPIPSLLIERPTFWCSIYKEKECRKNKVLKEPSSKNKSNGYFQCKVRQNALKSPSTRIL
jgi:hypothetical protein